MKNELKELFSQFLEDYDEDGSIRIWNDVSNIFRNFWEKKIVNDNYGELGDSELDDIIRYLDSNAKGNSRDTYSVAKAMISQGMWRRMFNDIHENKDLRAKMYELFTEKNDDKKIVLINDIYKLNEGRKNSLTGRVGNAINSMMFVFNPTDQVSAISLNHRRKIIEHFSIEGGPDFDKDNQGVRIIRSNRAIIDGFKKMGFNNTTRTICDFLYSSYIKNEWVNDSVDEIKDVLISVEMPKLDRESKDEIAQFYLEKHLEEFLIENWERTELGLKYEMIERDGEIVSQQYRTDIGLIDILVKEKQTGDYVVIELKKGQTSDDTVGQISRYMGWVEEKLATKEKVKGIIISSIFDQRLYYALKVVNNVEVYLYRVDFKLREFKE